MPDFTKHFSDAMSELEQSQLDGRLMRPEVLACQKRYDELLGQLEQVSDAINFWVELNDHHHPNGESCDKPDCLAAWREYPGG